MFELADKVAVVTGGASGIGQAISRVLAQNGAEIHILDRNKSAAAEAVSAIQEAGGKAFSYGIDVSLQDEVMAVFDEIHTRSQHIDILINNAGIAFVGNIETTTEADFDRIYQTNIKGVYNCALAAIQKMRLRREGVIINMASVAAVVGLPDRFAYSMSKGAVLTMTYALARDYVQENIRCNSISPGRVHTPFVDGFIAKNYPGKEEEMFEKLAKTQPIGRMAQPLDIANLCLFLCSDKASFITGTDYPIDGGFVRLNT